VNLLSRKNEQANKIDLNKEAKQEMILAIKTYFLNERDEDLGDMAAGFILDFVLEKLAPHIYNQGVYDSYKYMGERTEDLLGLLKY
jgi:uncharacterized protein (DUF2164 family)